MRQAPKAPFSLKTLRAGLAGLVSRAYFTYCKIRYAPSSLRFFFEGSGGRACDGNTGALYRHLMTDGQYAACEAWWGVLEAGSAPFAALRQAERTRLLAKGSKEYLFELAISAHWLTDEPLPPGLTPGEENQWILLPGRHCTPGQPRTAALRRKNRAIGKKVSAFISTSPAMTRELLDLYDLEALGMTGKIVELDAPADARPRQLAERLIRTAAGRRAMAKRDRMWRRESCLAYFTAFFRTRGLLLSRNSRRLKSYQNRHTGQRCFLVGNGPSLTMADLERLQGEVTFGCNMVFRCFGDTTWRPSYYVSTDVVYAPAVQKKENGLDMPIFTYRPMYRAIPNKPENLLYIYNVYEDPYFVAETPLAYSCLSQSTVMTVMIELAVYMGFREIYLIGVDNSNSLSTENTHTHFVDGYRDDAMVRSVLSRSQTRLAGKAMSLDELGAWYQDKSVYAYSKLREFCERRGRQIYNATRGGQLEVFPRAELDEALSPKKAELDNK